jgi:hypothetical protein
MTHRENLLQQLIDSLRNAPDDYLERLKNQVDEEQTRESSPEPPIPEEPPSRFRLKDPDVEIQEQIEANPPMEYNFQDSCIMLRHPHDVNAFNDIITRQRNRYRTNFAPTDPAMNYYMNNITSVDDIKTFVDTEIFAKEMKPYKINFSFGLIVEAHDNDRVFYDAIVPNFNDGRHVPKTISNDLDNDTFHDYVVSEITDYIQNETYISSNRHFVAIYSIGFNVGRLR